MLADELVHFLEIGDGVHEVRVLVAFLKQNVRGVIAMTNLYEQVVEVLLLLAEGDGHCEEVSELPNQVMEEHDHFDEGLTVSEDSFPPDLLLVGLFRGQFEGLVPVPVTMALQPSKIIVEKLLDLVHFDALVLHL